MSEDRRRLDAIAGRPAAAAGLAEVPDDLLLSWAAGDPRPSGPEPARVESELAERVREAHRGAASLVPSSLRRYLRLRWVERHPETVGVVWIGLGDHLLGAEAVYRGPLDLCALEPDGILETARRRGARELLLFWTNGGDSLGDVAHLWSRLVRLERACAEARLPLRDALMLSSRGWYSWRQGHGAEQAPQQIPGSLR